MKCSARQDELILYVDDEISDEKKIIIENHIQECANCMCFVNAVRNADDYAGRTIKCDRDLLAKVKEGLDRDYYKKKSYGIIHRIMFYWPLYKPFLAVMIIAVILFSLFYFNLIGHIRRTFF